MGLGDSKGVELAFNGINKSVNRASMCPYNSGTTRFRPPPSTSTT